jgi:uncharacterized protein VirK/YbjX
VPELLRIDAMMVLLRASSAAFPGITPGLLKLRLMMIARGVGMWRTLGPLTKDSGSAARRILAERPQLLGAILWPYQCAAWSPEERVHRIAQHYAEIDRLGPPFEFSVADRLVLADLGDLHPGLRLVLDQPHWFMREGGLTLNLFVGSFRAFSLTFSFFRDEEDRRAVFIGSLQGRNTDEALELYRTLTRSLYGMRPRDTLIEALRILCLATGTRRILAVAEAARHHRHAYFRNKATTQDYDGVWEDRDGSRIDALSYELPVSPPRRELLDVKANKRSMYRRRFAFLDALEAQIVHDLPGLRPVRFEDS